MQGSLLLLLALVASIPDVRGMKMMCGDVKCEDGFKFCGKAEKNGESHEYINCKAKYRSKNWMHILVWPF